ncbi:MAG: universal stress protein [Firmicutes bacterium]|nr:universal stress protein [Bacillota bacterium]
MKKYLLAVDGSEISKQAAKYLAGITKLHKTFDVTIAYVINLKKEYSHEPYKDINDTQQDTKANGSKLLNEYVVMFDKPITKVLLEGDPGAEIVKYANLNEFDHIVMGTRGLGNIKGFVLGSVSQRVVHDAKCPVTLVK